MKLQELVAQLRHQGIELWAEGEKLRYRALPGAMNGELRTAIVGHKSALLHLFQQARVSIHPPADASMLGCSEIPLTFLQERMWFLNQFAPNPSYNCYRAIRMEGRLNSRVLEDAINEIVRRHEILRTTFPSTNGQPFQVVMAPSTLDIPVVEVKINSESESEMEARNLITKEVEDPFDLVQGPLFRAKLFRLAPEDHILVLTLHHIITDGWSMQELLRELTLLYGAFCYGLPSPLSPLAMQYGQFAKQHRSKQEATRLDALLFWRERLKLFPSKLNLPTAQPRSATQTCQGGSESIVIPKWIADELRRFSLREGVTLFMTLVAAFQTLLYRYTNQEDIAIGSAFACRTSPGCLQSIGLFLETLVLRVNLSGEPSFRELVKRVQEVSIEAYTHPFVPFEELAQELRIKRSSTYAPFFQVFFVLQNELKPMLNVPDLTIQRFGIKRTSSMYDLALSMVESTEEIRGTLTYKSELFEAQYISRMIDHFHTLLRGIVTDPLRPISALPLITDAERHELLSERNDIRERHPETSSIHELFERQVSQSPAAVAVAFEGAHLTYQELDRKANQFAHHLKKLGVGRGSLVGVCIERSFAMVVALLGVLKAGGAYLPLDPDCPMERLQLILQDAQPTVLLSQGQSFQAFSKQGLKVALLEFDQESVSQESETTPLSVVTCDDLAYVIYTSGSTGKPKGVEITHRALTNFVNAACSTFGVGTDDRILQFAPLNFDAAFEEIFPCLVSGATLVLRTSSMLNSFSTFLQKCHEWQITILDLPTAFWHEMVESLSSNGLNLPSSLRLVIIGGEQANSELVALWSRLSGTSVRLFNTYGPTETTVVTTVWQLKNDSQPPIGTWKVPIGRPILDSQVYVLDSALEPVPAGVAGELYIGGVGLARGYLNRSDLTAEKFIPHPFRDDAGARLYKTGDLVRYLFDGNLEFLGRIDNQVKIRGFRIEMGEIEATLRQHSGVREVVVAAYEENLREIRLVAYIVSREPMDSVDLRNFLETKLPDYMVPSMFMFLDSVPLTPRGKIDRQALPPPDRNWPGLEAGFIAPRTPTEELLAQLWSDVLHLNKIGIRDNFFELGGHSLLAMKVMSRLRDLFSVDLPLRSLFESPTVAGLAERIDNLSSRRSQEATETLEEAETIEL